MTPLEQLWVKEGPKLRKYLRKRLHRPEIEDVIAEAFTELQRMDEHTHVPGMLWHIAFHKRADVYRRRARREYAEEQAEILHGTAIPNIETAIFRADFDRAFRRLPRLNAEAFALIELRGLTERETAQILGVSQSTAHRRCEAARSLLAEELR